jgi:hypothetical protein
MKNRGAIAAMPVALAAVAYGTLASRMGAHGDAGSLPLWVGLIAKLAAAVGCFLAAAQFDRGDYMRRAWSFMGVTYAILFSNTVLFSGSIQLAGGVLPERAQLILSGVLVGVANVSTIVGVLLVARTWKAAGMDFQVSNGVKVAAIAGSLVLALGIAGSSALADLQAVAGGHLESLSDLCSAIGDIASLAVLAPIVLTALSLRGGSLFWPWGMLAAGTFAWVLFDGTATFAGLLHLDPAHVRPLTEAFRVAGCVAYLSAGLFQRAARLEVASAPPAVAVG